MDSRHWPTNWKRGFQWPLRIAGGGDETPFLRHGRWYIRVYDCEARKHYLYCYATDLLEAE